MRTFAICAALLLLTAPALAQQPPPAALERAIVGLPGGTAEPPEPGRAPTNVGGGRSRNGAWAPVYVQVVAGRAAIAPNTFQVVVETTDSEDVGFRTVLPVPGINPGELGWATGYTRPGATHSSFTFRLQTAEGRDLQTWPRVTRDGRWEEVRPREVLYLTVGGRLPTLRTALRGADDGMGGRDAGPAIDDVAFLPDKWYGYQAADVVVLSTGSTQFLDELLSDAASSRRKALAEWVHRGGKLVVSLGRNHDRAARVLQRLTLPEVDVVQQGIIDCQVKGPIAAKSVSRWSGRNAANFAAPLRAEKGEIGLAELAPGPGTNALVVGEADGTERPLVVQGSCGLGRVLLVAFDVDTAPFTTWDRRDDFWKWLNAELVGGRGPANNPGGREADLAGPGVEVQRSMENFEDVPVISFGWVALFILIYILIVGPLDYFILKKVVKRLELTWITFPAVVLVISVAAYFTAYYLKGDELRVNKLDLIEFDLESPQAYGTTWVSLFSPRIQNYTVGLDPQPAWLGESEAGGRASVLLGPLERPQAGFGGPSRGLFSRSYAYAPDLSGVRDVPIGVWASRSFGAVWRSPLAGKPPIEADLRHPQNDRSLLIGTITHHLPVPLQDVRLIYQDQVYNLDNRKDLQPGEPGNVTQLQMGGKQQGGNRQPLATFFNNDVLQPRGAPTVPTRRQNLKTDHGGGPSLSAANVALKQLMFFGQVEAGLGDSTNAGYRTLDQSWRLRQIPKLPDGRQDTGFREEVILVARAPLLYDRARQLKADAPPTRLWLDYLPGDRKEPAALPGWLTQDTYVRVYIPVK